MCICHSRKANYRIKSCTVHARVQICKCAGLCKRFTECTILIVGDSWTCGYRRYYNYKHVQVIKIFFLKITKQTDSGHFTLTSLCIPLKVTMHVNRTSFNYNMSTDKLLLRQKSWEKLPVMISHTVPWRTMCNW